MSGGSITAGEWNDLEHWEFWQDLMQNQDQNENSYQNMVKKWGFQDPTKLNLTCQMEDVCRFYTDKNQLDLTFMVDTTGSMGDELDYLKSELKNVVQRVSANNSNLSIKIATVFYRDHSDEYTVRKFDFNDDVDQIISQIKDQAASGGGDFPEAADEALQISIEKLSWRENSRKLLFWVADAPIHNNSKNIELFQSEVAQARFAKNISIIPIASSGIDKATEMLMRATAIYTNGTYVFLTDDSGIGNSHLKPTIGSFQVENLNDLLVRIINERI